MTSRPAVNVDASCERWLEPPWPTAFELAALLPQKSWTLVGGLMVQLHARLADLPTSRATRDVDATLHLETRSTTFEETACLLEGACFQLDGGTAYAYRFDRGDERVDVLCSDRYAAWKRPEYRGRPLFGVPGGTRALMDTLNVTLTTPNGGRLIVTPSLKGAAVMKAAALQEDSRDKERHAEDLMLLLACADDPSTLTRGLSTRSRKRLRRALRYLETHPDPWIAHEGTVQGLAREAHAALAEQFDAHS